MLDRWSVALSTIVIVRIHYGHLAQGSQPCSAGRYPRLLPKSTTQLPPGYLCCEGWSALVKPDFWGILTWHMQHGSRPTGVYVCASAKHSSSKASQSNLQTFGYKVSPSWMSRLLPRTSHHLHCFLSASSEVKATPAYPGVKGELPGAQRGTATLFRCTVAQ
jgi:hypothetical protein